VYYGWLAEAGSATRREVAVKVIYLKPQDVDHSPRRLLSHILREVLPWHALHHPNVVPFIGYDLGKDSARLFSEWQHNGHALEYVKKYPEADRLKLIRETAEGLGYLHNRRPAIVHGDLKPENVLIDAYGTAKLSDFGLSTAVDEARGRGLRSSTGFCGTLRYSDPVLLDNHPNTVSTDIWSLGWFAFEVVTLERPYAQCHSERAVFQAMIKYEVPRSIPQPTARRRALADPRVVLEARILAEVVCLEDRSPSERGS